MTKAFHETGKACLTQEIFEAMRQLNNLVLRCDMIPTRLLYEVPAPLDKVPGLMNIENKRPIGLCETLLQALFGTRFVITSDVWEKYGIIDRTQAAYTWKLTTEMHVMDVTSKAE
jgi:hypothetical protein